MNRTPTISPAAHTKKWFLVDARYQVLGRLASKISYYLRGKNQVYFSPNIDCGANIIVINAKDIILTGKKWTDKIYYSHSEYPGGLKAKSAKFIHDKDQTKLLEMAIRRMLPKNRLSREQLKSLFIYSDEEHKHSGQKPVELKFS